MKKIIITSIIIILIGIGTVSYYLHKKQVSQNLAVQVPSQAFYTTKISPDVVSLTITPSQLPSQTIADTTVQTYYNWYLTCLKNHFKNPSGSPEQDCPYNKTGALTGELSAQLKQAQGFDPILCAQNTPLQITYDKAVIIDTHASTTVHTIWGASPNQDIIVELNNQNSTWKISKITCPIHDK